MSDAGAGALPWPLPESPLVDRELVLRPWGHGDAPALAAAWGDPEVARWTAVPEARTEEAATRWIAGDAHRRANGASLDLALDVSGHVVGEVGVIPVARRPAVVEVGWWVLPAVRGRGLATRAVRLFGAWVLDELCVDRLVARCAVGNPAAGGVARAAGFTVLGVRDGLELWELRPAPGATIGP